MNRSLLVVDVQKGFTELCPMELPVPGGLVIVPKINQLLSLKWRRIDASQDWHPPDHCSFLGRRDNLYPPHCLAGSEGADFLPGLHSDRFHAIWRKGFERDRDAYAVTAQHPGLISLFRHEKIEEIIICGLATNICCFFAARDLVHAGFRVGIVEDASAGIDVPASELFQDKAKKEGLEMGIRYLCTGEIR